MQAGMTNKFPVTRASDVCLLCEFAVWGSARGRDVTDTQTDRRQQMHTQEKRAVMSGAFAAQPSVEHFVDADGDAGHE